MAVMHKVAAVGVALWVLSGAALAEEWKLAKDKDGKLSITKEPNGSNPVVKGLTPIMGFDVWEHSYYLDYQNRRADHVNKLWEIIDWDVVEKRL